MRLIAGDIGGTKTILALYTTESGSGSPLCEDIFSSGSYGSLEAVVREFTVRHGIDGVDHAVFGVAGPVVGEKARITNLTWEIDAGHLAEEFAIGKVRLINDLQAVAYSISLLREEDLYTLNRGAATKNGPRAVIAAGTGLGEAYLTWDGLHYIAHASEGGHTEFGPADALELDLLKYLLDRFDHVSYERICSGTGIPNIYAFLKDTGLQEEPGWFEEKLRTASDKTAAIVSAGLGEGEPCGICRETLRLLLSILGAEAGNLALKIFSSGGVYVGGGIPPRLQAIIPESPFMESFFRKGRLSRILAPFPVHIILNPRAGLMGAAFFGLEIMDVLP